MNAYSYCPPLILSVGDFQQLQLCHRSQFRNRSISKKK